MKKVIIKEATLKNIKGIRDYKVSFANGITTICGENGTGKSTLFDAFTWVLFGKDAQGNSDTKFSIKTLDTEGKPIERLEHEATLLLNVDGTDVELRRAIIEDWGTTSEGAPIFKGNHTEYYYNGVPLKAGEYKAKVDAIIEEDIFKVLTNPTYFANLHWEAQREMLLRMAGGVTLEEVAGNRAEFLAVLSQLSGKSIAEFKTELAARKKKLTERLEDIPNLIKGINMAQPESHNFAKLDAELKEVISALENIDSAIADKAEETRKIYASSQATQNQINELKTKQQIILFAAKETEAKRLHEASSVYNNAVASKEAKGRELGSYRSLVDAEKREVNALILSQLGKVSTSKKAVENLREEWHKVNAETYKESSEGFICPLSKVACGDTKTLQIVAGDTAKAKQAFEDDKEAKLTKITKEGESLNTTINESKQEIEKLNERLAKIETESTAKIETLEVEINHLGAVVADNPRCEENAYIKGEDLPQWMDAETEITTLSATLSEIKPIDNAELMTSKREVSAQIDELKKKLALRDVIEKNEKQIADLQAEEKNLAQQKADLEKQEFAVDGLVKAQIDEVERRVNHKFTIVRFRMFTSQINGTEKPDCVPMVDGVKYSDVNNAGRINAGLDIINALCEFHQVSAPIFIDNAESVNELLPTDSQLVRLVVSADKELKVIHS